MNEKMMTKILQEKTNFPLIECMKAARAGKDLYEATAYLLKPKGVSTLLDWNRDEAIKSVGEVSREQISYWIEENEIKTSSVKLYETLHGKFTYEKCESAITEAKKDMAEAIKILIKGGSSD